MLNNDSFNYLSEDTIYEIPTEVICQWILDSISRESHSQDQKDE